MKELIKTSKQTASKFVEELKAIGQLHTELCKRYVKAINEFEPGELRGHMREQGVKDFVLDLMENVGRGLVIPEFLAMDSPAITRAMKAPIEEQRRMEKEGVRVVEIVGNKTRTVVKSLATMKQKESKLAIDPKRGQVPIEEQEQLLREKAQKGPEIFVRPPWFVLGGILFVRKNAQIPREVLKQIISDMDKADEEKKKTLEAVVKKRQIVK